jgi:hypothetical protein
MPAQLADDAIIDSAAAGGKSRRRGMQRSWHVFRKGALISADIRDMSVTVHDPPRATVLGTAYLQNEGGAPDGTHRTQAGKARQALAHRGNGPEIAERA